MIINTVKITSNGQVTLPIKVRNILNTDTISFDINSDNEIIIKPVYSVAGALSSYAKDIDFNDARQSAEQEAIDNNKALERMYKLFESQPKDFEHLSEEEIILQVNEEIKSSRNH